MGRLKISVIQARNLSLFKREHIQADDDDDSPQPPSVSAAARPGTPGTPTTGSRRKSMANQYLAVELICDDAYALTRHTVQARQGAKWNETFELAVMKHTMPKLVLKVLATSRPGGANGCALAGALIPIAALRDGDEYREWHTLLTGDPSVYEGEDDAVDEEDKGTSVGEVELVVQYNPDRHEQSAVVEAGAEHVSHKAEDALVFASRMAMSNQADGRAFAHSAMGGAEVGDTSSEDEDAPEWLAGYKRLGNWDETLHGKPDEVRTPAREAVEDFPPRVKRAALVLLLNATGPS